MAFRYSANARRESRKMDVLGTQTKENCAILRIIKEIDG